MTRDRLIRWIFVLYAASLIVAVISLLPTAKWKTRATGRKSGRLAIVHVFGTIKTNMSSSPWGAPDADDIAHQLNELSEEDDVKAILLRINSPGGTVAAVQEIHAEILRCKAKGQKIIASMGDVAASGGYYLASAADQIVADPGTITGSIGVILEFGNFEGLMQKLGVKLQVIKSGAHKDIGSPARALTPEEQQILQASINDAYQQFVDAVVQGRHLSEEKVRVLADGRIFTGRQAQQVGLVDKLGNSEVAKELAIRLGNLPDHPVLVTDSGRSLHTFIKHLSSQSSQGSLDVLAEHWGSPSMEYRWR